MQKRPQVGSGDMAMHADSVVTRAQILQGRGCLYAFVTSSCYSCVGRRQQLGDFNIGAGNSERRCGRSGG